jgi:hypothetical protein
VREDPLLFRPEPDRGKVLVLARGKVHDTVDASPNADEPPVPQVLKEELRGVAGLSRLLRREVPLLADDRGRASGCSVLWEACVDGPSGFSSTR